MKKTEFISVRVSAQTKNESEAVLKELNLRMSDAITLFLNQISMEKGLPFKVRIPKYEKAYQELGKAIAYNSFGGGEPSKYAKNILMLYAKDEIDFETAEFALKREKINE